MKSLVVFLALVAVAYSKSIEQIPLEGNTAYGYLEKSIPRAEQIRQSEEKYLASQSRIVGGVPAALGQYPWQAGLLIDIIGLNGNGVCGGSLISPLRVVTAAHCWFDGQHQGWRLTVVLGSVFLFSGGTRLQTSAIAVHNNWQPVLARNDVAVIYLPEAVSTGHHIAPIALASNRDESFVDESVIASGFGLTSDDGAITQNQHLNHVRLTVITNTACSFWFPLIIQDSNICTSGVGGTSTCRGDSGGPLIASRNGENILIGITSFGSPHGCQANRPAAYARVTSFLDFLHLHI